ncbi:Mu-like prophage major head subunit gpT [Malonomonas rubra DSM 5091]|uniref:Mu-like prophage major head subunit gpT n=1 Tax=Malonomonas rubra DSM 5091 TaxID=1122189 RepID=A0A1M6HNR4_MALRU|nr:Mu-like prophage major head subunit gpT family protein [Malonomonas rubra]SHJ23839.1 Mu-like prophage major head subunit gpT [Malonomonas rubra DSM 5091]
MPYQARDLKLCDYRDEATELLARNAGLKNCIISERSNRFENLFGDVTLRDLARASLREAGLEIPSDANQLIGRALTTSDFPKILSGVVNKALDEGFGYASQTFLDWVAKKAVPDFKLAEFPRLVPAAELFECIEDDEIRSLVLAEGAESGRIKTYAGIGAISRQALVNDDLGVLQDFGGALGQTAANTQSKQVYKKLLENPALSDGVAMFHTDRDNLISGAGSALSRGSLAGALKVFRTMTDSNGTPLAIEPKFLLVPPSLEVTAFELCYSDSVPGQTNSAVMNLFKKIGLVPIVEPRLESPLFSGSSSTAWYLLPDPNIRSVIASLALGDPNKLQPYVKEKAMFERDATEYKARIDFGVVPMSPYAVKSEGV